MSDTRTVQNAPKFYALLVGVNGEGLEGCERDVRAMEQWLSKNMKSRGFAEPLHIKTLTQDATKEKVSVEMLAHLTQAEEGDMAFFYYTGHGGFENANEFFDQIETDDQLETIVLADSRSGAERGALSGTDLADKELSYLLKQIDAKKPRIVTVFDCCYSGGNVRSIGPMDEEEIVPVSKKAPPADATRAWDHFIFSPNGVNSLREKLASMGRDEVAQRLKPIELDDLKKRDLIDPFPMPAVMKLAACRADENAWEDSVWEEEGHEARLKGGQFTHTLLSVLDQAKGAISYYDLNKHAQRFLVNKKKRQTPQIQAFQDAKDWMHEGFLGGAVNNEGIYGTIQINNDFTWIINMGAIHGILPPEQSKELKIRVEDNDGKVLGKVGIMGVHPTYSELDDPEFLEIPLDEDSLEALQKVTYKGFLENFMTAPINIALAELNEAGELIEGEGPGLKVFKKEMEGQVLNHLVFEPQKDAQYQLIARGKTEDYIIAKADDPNYKPIVKPESGKSVLREEGFQAKGAKRILKYLKQIAHWEFVKSLENSASKALPLSIEVDAMNMSYDHATSKWNNKGKKAILPDNHGAYRLEYNYEGWEMAKHKQGFFSVKLTNNGSQKLNIAPLMLSVDYSIVGIPGQDDVFSLEAGISHVFYVRFDFQTPDHIRSNPKAYIDAFLKFFISERDLEFDMEKFKTDALPAPSLKQKRTSTEFKELQPINMNVDDWAAQGFTFKMRNPFVKKDSEESK